MLLFLRTDSWVSPPVTVAVGARDRWRGLRPRSAGRSLLLGGRAVHGVGLQEALWAVGLDREGRVVDLRLLRPGRFVVLDGASWVLELAATRPPPTVGSALRMTRASG